MVSVMQIADYIIHWHLENQVPITSLKLLKLIYYAEAWFLAGYEETLIGEPIEAWQYGPVVRRVYNRYRTYGDNNITSIPALPIFDERIKRHLDFVLSTYGNLSAWDLSHISHSEDPWRNAREGLQDDEYSNRYVPREDMKTYYGRFIQNSLLEAMEDHVDLAESQIARMEIQREGVVDWTTIKQEADLL